MQSGGFIVNSVPVSIGDAKITLYHMRDLETRPTDRMAGMIHCHLFYEIRIALEGSYEYAFRNKNVKIGAGEMLIIPPGEYHYALVDGTDYREAVCSLLPQKISENESGATFYGKLKGLLDLAAGVPVKTTPELIKNVSDFLKCQEEEYSEKESTDRLFRQKLAATSLLRELFACLEAVKAQADVQSERKESLSLRVEMKTALL